MDIKAVAKAIFEENKDIIVTWFSVLTYGPSGLRGIELGEKSTLVYALRFMLYMGFVDTLLSVSFSTGLRATGDTLAVVEIFAEFLGVALILHGCMKLFGGQGTMQGAIAGYCFLTAYMPILSVLMFPNKRLISPLIAQGLTYPEAVSRLADELPQLKTWDLSVLVLSFLASTVVLILFLAGVFRFFRALHKLSWFRAGLAFVFGLVCVAAFEAMLVLPILSRVYQAFATG